MTTTPQERSRRPSRPQNERARLARPPQPPSEDATPLPRRLNHHQTTNHLQDTTTLRIRSIHTETNQPPYTLTARTNIRTKAPTRTRSYPNRRVVRRALAQLHLDVRAGGDVDEGERREIDEKTTITAAPRAWQSL